jgi:amino acid adenylation domain-containing protein/non-ribosomal peptide synthase protein (TIGR01720 family)
MSDRDAAARNGAGACCGERLVALSADGCARLAERAVRVGSHMDGPQSVQREEGSAAFPLSFAQERLWFLESVAPGNAVCKIAGAIRLIGRLDVEALFWSLGQLTLRHEILRTVFPSVEGRPTQVICSGAGPAPRTRDLAHVAGPARERELVRLMAEEAEQPFNIGLGPLWRTTLFALGAEEHVLAVTLHHIIADAWSVRVLVDELLRFYDARKTGSKATVCDLPFQYADYAVWQRARAAAGALREGLEYWKRALGTGRAVWECPLDHPRPRVLDFQAHVEARTLPAASVRRLAERSVQSQVTPFMVFLGAFTVLLSRWADVKDVCVLTAVANRVGAGVERCAGFFVNVLPLRVQVDPGATFTQLMEHVRTCTLSAYANQHVPFELLLAAIEAERRIDRPPLSTVGFTLESVRADRWRVGPLAVELEERQRQAVETDLLLVVRHGRAGVTARVEYRRDLFEPATITRLLDGYGRTLEWLLDHPERRLSELRDEEWRGGAPQAPPRRNVAGERAPREPGTVMDGFAAQVRSVPEKTAVASATAGRLSYAELDAMAAQLAAALRRRGAGVETLVAVLGRRSPQYVAAVLGVLKAGSAFLPIDPGLPAMRIDQIVRESGARLLVVDEASVPLVSERSSSARRWPDVLILQDALRDAAPWPEDVKNRAHDLAYVVFTSGSTGVPKGAMIEHRGMLNHLRAKIALLGLGADDRVAQTASQSFDISVWQWCAPLLVGATVEILDDEDVRDPQRLVAQVARRAVSILELVPSMLRVVLDEVEACPRSAAQLDALRAVVVTGEPLAPALCRRWLRLYPRVPLINAYGPTECADDVTHFEVRVPPAADELRVPIGKAIANIRLYVDDGTLGPAEPGRSGELCVAGAGVGRGYVNDPEHTAEAFDRDPLSIDPTAQMYRTGDIVRVLADGNLDLLGRRDQQVKVAGCRVELGEIEATLKCHPQVHDAVVVARAEEDGPLRLTAYVVPARDAAPPSGELRRYLAQRLAEQMVPSRFIEVNALPLTANLKVDREALARSGASRPGTGDGVELPRRSKAEELLAGIWQEVLGLEHIGQDENFFDLGGDSILSIRVSAKARRAGLCVTAKDVFEHPTIARLAAVASWQDRGTAEQDLVVGPVALTPAQQGFFAQAPASPERYAMSTLVEIGHDLDPLLLTAAVEKLALHHDALRLRFTRGGDEWRQECASPGAVGPVRCMDFRNMGDRTLRKAVRAVDTELRQSLNLSAGPVVALAKIACGRRHGGLLAVVAHHLVCDTVSAHILLEDLETTYTQLAAGCPVSLPAKTTSFRDWSERLVAYARSPECLAQVPYWLSHVVPDGYGLPCDLPGGANGDDVLCAASAQLEADETRLLIQRAARRQHATAQDLLLGAFLHALAPWLGARSLVIQLEGHARAELCPDADVSRTVGWFATGYPVAFDVSAARSIRGAVDQVRAVLSGVPQSGLGFGALRYLSRDAFAAPLRAAPPPEVKFNYLGIVDPGCARSRIFTRVWASNPPRAVVFPKRAHVLEVTLVVIDGRLRVIVEYSKGLHRRATINGLLSAFIAALRHVARAGENQVGAAEGYVRGAAEGRMS